MTMGNQWLNALSLIGVVAGVGFSAYGALSRDANVLIFALSGWAAAVAIAVSSQITMVRALSELRKLAADYGAQSARIAHLTSENAKLIELSNYIASQSFVGSRASAGAIPRVSQKNHEPGDIHDH